MLAKSLNYGDTIGIIAPSFEVSIDSMAKYEEAKKFFKGKGFKIKEGKFITEKWLGSAGTPQQRAQDLNNMFADTDVSAIICLCGGGTSNMILPYINFDIIKNNPKIFMGYSDISVLNQVIYDRTGLVTFNGPLFMDFGDDTFAENNYETLVNRLIQKNHHLKSDANRKTVRSGKAEGIFLGTNIKCSMHLLGTDFFPDFSGKIAGLEAYFIEVYDCALRFSQLRQNGFFDNLSAAIVGYNYSMQTEKNINKPQMEDILLEITKDMDFPILKCNNFGHEIANDIIPIGVKMTLDADSTTIDISEQFLI